MKQTEFKFPDKEHVESEACWCEPVLSYEDPETGVQVWVHKSNEETNQQENI